MTYKGNCSSNIDTLEVEVFATIWNGGTFRCTQSEREGETKRH